MPSLIKHPIRAIIVDDSQSDKCDARCGEDWASTQVIALASQRIKQRFGNEIRLEYLDMAKPLTTRQALKLKRQAKHENLTLPLLVINGEPRISGQFDIRQLLDAIDAELEIKS